MYSRSTPEEVYSNTRGVFLQVTEITPQYSWKLSSVNLSKRLLEISLGNLRGIFEGILFGFLCLLMKSSLRMNSISMNSSLFSISKELDSVTNSKKFKICVNEAFTHMWFWQFGQFSIEYTSSYNKNTFTNKIQLTK